MLEHECRHETGPFANHQHRHFPSLLLYPFSSILSCALPAFYDSFDNSMLGVRTSPALALGL